MNYKFLLDIALILIFTKVLGIFMKKLGLPQVVGAIIAGLLLGPSVFKLIVPPPSGSADPLKILAEIGVILILFSAGMTTNLKELKKNGIPSVVITLAGVIVPFVLGFFVSALFLNKWSINFTPLFNDKTLLLKTLFFGTILTATSVGITVEALHELGKLNGKVGVSILGAAVLDDIIGIVILAVVQNLAGSTSGDINIGAAFGNVLLNLLYFFLGAIGLGIIFHFSFKYFGKKFNNKRRLPILTLAICFLFAYASEKLFGIADIAGAFIAGVFIANLPGIDYIEKKIDTSSYLLFSPIFFARIGITTDLRQMFAGSFTFDMFLFILLFVVFGLMSKFIGCYSAARLCKYTRHESAAVGVGMMVRGEVALVVAAKGMDLNLFDAEFLPAVIILIIISSLIAPILLKTIFRYIKNEPEIYNIKYSGEEAREGYMPAVIYPAEKIELQNIKFFDKYSEYNNNIDSCDRDGAHTIEIDE